jgi:hypothetical protein
VEAAKPMPWLNLPNAITLGRIALAVLLAPMLLKRRSGTSRN